MSELKTYDPNIRWAKQKVRLTLKQWAYTATLETTVGGNCQGFDIFDTAINNAWEELPTREYPGLDEPVAYVTLTDPSGETLECEDDEQDFAYWLQKMVVGIEIIEQVPDAA